MSWRVLLRPICWLRGHDWDLPHSTVRGLQIIIREQCVRCDKWIETIEIMPSPTKTDDGETETGPYGTGGLRYMMMSMQVTLKHLAAKQAKEASDGNADTST